MGKGNKKSMTELVNDFRATQRAMEALQKQLPRIIGTEAVRCVKQNFQLQGYDTGSNFIKWPSRSDATNWAYDNNRGTNAQRISVGKNGKVRRGSKFFATPTGRQSKAKNPSKGSDYHSSNPILLQTRTLFRGITYFPATNKVTVGVDPNLIVYAQKMNEGGRGKWGKNARTNTPARQFMPRPGQPANPKIMRWAGNKVKYEQEKIMAPFRK